MTVDEIVRRVRERSDPVGIRFARSPAADRQRLLAERRRAGAGDVEAARRCWCHWSNRADGRDGAADPAHRRTCRAMPARSPFPAAAARPAMRCRGHGAARDRGGGRARARRFVDVVGAVDLYRTGTGFEITPVVGIVDAGLHHSCRSARGRRRVRGAARRTSSTRSTTRSTAASTRAASGAITPCPTASATSGARLPAC